MSGLSTPSQVTGIRTVKSHLALDSLDPPPHDLPALSILHPPAPRTVFDPPTPPPTPPPTSPLSSTSSLLPLEEPDRSSPRSRLDTARLAPAATTTAVATATTAASAVIAPLLVPHALVAAVWFVPAVVVTAAASVVSAQASAGTIDPLVLATSARNAAALGLGLALGIWLTGLVATNTVLAIDCSRPGLASPEVCSQAPLMWTAIVAAGWVLPSLVVAPLSYRLLAAARRLSAEHGRLASRPNAAPKFLSFRAWFVAVRAGRAGALDTNARRSAHGSPRADAPRTVAVSKRPGGNYPDNAVSSTKYTLLSFVPRNLMEQFSRFMNVYFLLIATLQLNPTLAPVNPLTTWIPLILIFTASAVREAFDDIERARRDAAVNARPVLVASGPDWASVPSRRLHVGSLVLLHQDELVPADLVVLATSAPNGSAAFVETANLDGETDLKARAAPPATSARLTSRGDSPDPRLWDDVVVTAPAPDPHLYAFDAQLVVTPHDADAGDSSDAALIPLTPDSLLLQGSVLKQVAFAVGVVVYTGCETKLANNKSPPRGKTTALDDAINSFTRTIFCIQLAAAVVLGFAGNATKAVLAPRALYLAYPASEWSQLSPWASVVLPLRFLLLISYMIPISLKITLEMLKTFYAALIGWDLALYHAETDTPAAAVSTGLAEDLGVITHVLTDKTGTLTNNEMALDSLAWDGLVYHTSHEQPALVSALDNGVHAALGLVTAMAVCHNAVPLGSDAYAHSRDLGQLSWSAASPDEEALVAGAAGLGYVCVRRSAPPDSARGWLLDVHARAAIGTSEPLIQPVAVVAHLAFSSERKRSGVLVRFEPSVAERGPLAGGLAAFGEYVLFVKGADSSVFPRLRAADSSAAERLEGSLLRFGTAGLRTLVYGYRVVPRVEAEQWLAGLDAARASMRHRAQRVAATYAALERGLTLLGASAVEDKLQEGVPETIAQLRKAGIRFWMLTGDKESTARQIAISCNLVGNHGAAVVPLTSIARAPNEVHAILGEASRNMGPETSLVIDGASLRIVLSSAREYFVRLALSAAAVVCCRMSPDQKAELVREVQALGRGARTLAIGDGGNDVAMLQAAAVGVGISGREGLQAARAADYAVAQFRFLGRLLLVHGRYAYTRTAYVAQYCFYKSIYLCSVQVFYNGLAGYSGISYFNTFALTLYNVAITGLPILSYALDRDVPIALAMANPGLYQHRLPCSVASLTRWMGLGVAQGGVALGVALLGAGHVGFDAVSMVTYSILVLVTLAMLSIGLRAPNAIHASVLGATLLTYFVLVSIYSSIPRLAFFGTMGRLATEPTVWLSVVLGTSISLILPALQVGLQRRRVAPVGNSSDGNSDGASTRLLPMSMS
ncbi:aminophospholipid ATPase [Thecamonas trahens ATCC 50062]|uniref:Phospholipid-transporting ATPase n=1 Tax=Thecamonas trahens ATCC 50062 TaxID=461836 RepID=A0A0L0D8D1_THETB|nr:aminophospholipid ATPase [Thecamonas trahens ATCC 50062]KNC48500.1 aminophospholipid ATPase [Thecamonas trahens ATCC 50062]|eukprot:XP_013758610.1 aminophospholipid ATPase [Thecamonas trahens ATCC 50062]